MDSVEVVRSAFGGAHMWYNGTVADITDEQANAVPPGVAWPIGAIMSHVLSAEDFMINQVVQGKPLVWNDSWKAKVGDDVMFEMTAENARGYNASVSGLAEYGRAVFENTEGFLAGLTATDLDREVNLKSVGFPNNMSLGVFLTSMLLGNTYAHTGEISCLKGSLGNKGYPF